MKNIQRRNHLSGKTALVVGVFLVITSLIASYYYLSQRENKSISDTTEIKHEPKLNDVNLNPATNNQITAGHEVKKANLAQNETTPGSSDNESSFTINITAANQNNGTLQIRTLIDTVISDGTCELTMTNQNEHIARSSDIQLLANSSTCKGFDIPISELNSGEWQITVKAIIAEKSGTASKQIRI